MHIKNGLVFQENKTFKKQDVYTLAGKIVTAATWENARMSFADPSGTAADTDALSAAVSDFSVIDAKSCLILPGLIDIHSHGAVGHDFSDADPEGLHQILCYERSHGVTSYCPTSMTLSLEELLNIFSVGASAAQNFNRDHKNSNAVMVDSNTSVSNSSGRGDVPARIAGFHMEGPFLDPAKKGAHQEALITDPNVNFFRACSKASRGNIRLVTLAPNMPGAMSFIREFSKETVISLGHTNCDYDTAKAALDAGAQHLTHLYNAMPELCHRSPGLIGAAADTPECMAELIADGIHSHDAMIRNAFRLFRNRVILISDSMRATGLADGDYDLGGQAVQVQGKLATLADGTIAGSCTNLFDCMRHAVSAGVPKEEAIAAATIHPAKSIGIFDQVGSVTVGKRADLLLTDEHLNLKSVL